MNVVGILSRLVRLFLRRAASRGARRGIDRLAGQDKPPDRMTPEDRRKARATKAQAKTARRALRTIRRFGRF